MKQNSELQQLIGVEPKELMLAQFFHDVHRTNFVSGIAEVIRGGPRDALANSFILNPPLSPFAARFRRGRHEWLLCFNTPERHLSPPAGACLGLDPFAAFYRGNYGASFGRGEPASGQDRSRRVPERAHDHGWRRPLRTPARALLCRYDFSGHPGSGVGGGCVGRRRAGVRRSARSGYHRRRRRCDASEVDGGLGDGCDFGGHLPCEPLHGVGRQMSGTARGQPYSGAGSFAAARNIAGVGSLVHALSTA